MSVVSRMFGRGSGATSPHHHDLLENFRWELIPMKSVHAQIEYLPANSHVSVTCSPAKGIDATIDLAEVIQSHGHTVVPHLAARMMESTDHLHRIVARMVALGIDEVFVVGGDAPEPLGPWEDAVKFMADLIAAAPHLRHIGFAAYPDGHSAIPSTALHDALHEKQRMVADAGVEAHVSTQMCFDAKAIERWIIKERAAGFVLPVYVGLPGAVERTKLVTMGAQLGVGASVRYLKKNAASIARLFAPGGYDPNVLLEPLSKRQELGIEGVHSFTFNQVEATEAWRQASL
jgi:methylenetetrahydrofolate reductase (NADPH)